jgi:hypothetical protein
MPVSAPEFVLPDCPPTEPVVPGPEDPRGWSVVPEPFWFVPDPMLEPELEPVPDPMLEPVPAPEPLLPDWARASEPVPRTRAAASAIVWIVRMILPLDCRPFGGTSPDNPSRFRLFQLCRKDSGEGDGGAGLPGRSRASTQEP